MWLVVGLGNPGPSYALTRHNAGFMVLDFFLKGLGNPPTKNDFKSVVSKFKIDGEDVLTLQPQTFMNRSGEAVRAISDFYKIPLDNLIVVYDEIDLPFGTIRLQKNRGAGGHNGIKDIIEKMGSNDFTRIRVGVGRPLGPQSVADYVLQKFSQDEFEKLPEILNRCGEALESIIFDGLAKASNKFNTSEEKV